MDIIFKNSTYKYKPIALLVALIIVTSIILTSSHRIYAAQMEPQGVKEVIVYLVKEAIGVLVQEGMKWTWKTIPTVITGAQAATVLSFAAIGGLHYMDFTYNYIFTIRYTNSEYK